VTSLPMDPFETREIGTTGLLVTRLGLGGAPLGGLFDDVAGDVASGVVRRAYDLGIRYFDTAPLYGHGKSERFVGEGLASMPRDEFVLSTKVGRVLDPVNRPPDDDYFSNLPAAVPRFDYSRDGILRSINDSLERLQLDRIDIALIHDPDTAETEDPEHWRRAVGEGYPTLDGLRSQGVVRAIGVGMNSVEPLLRLVAEGGFDCFLLAGRYTLLDQSGLEELMPLCGRRGTSILIGGPYNSGILSSDLSPGAKFFYEDASPDVLERARKLKAVCDRHDVPLKAAALQFGLAHPVVAASIPGARTAAEVEENVAMVRHAIPDALWDDLRGEALIPEAALVGG